ncbi:GDSL-type esterase/lipase family protein [Cellulomonas sp. McL0617]|uniref:GDSL-type esterase/lipase family protein n=1 Tax=Cellulomonas sp. McL0617 TaxID=3415675 RepID=UPI003CF91A20
MTVDVGAVRSVLATALGGTSGALETDVDLDGVVLHRVPARARARLAEQPLDFMSAVPSGVRLRVHSDAPWLELDADFVRVVSPLDTTAGTVVDLVVDGELRPPIVTTDETVILIDMATGDMETHVGATATLRLELGAPGLERDVEVWLPHASQTTLRDLRVPAGAAVRAAAATGRRWVHHGSSISQCSEANRPTSTWPAIVARTAGLDMTNLGIGGQCHLDPFMARAIRDLPAHAISLEIGINVVNGDTMRERAFVPALHGFLDTIREGHPDTPILVVTPIICPAAEDEPGPTIIGPDQRACTVTRPDVLAAGALSLKRIRQLIHRAVEIRRSEGDQHLQVLDGLTLFGPDDVVDLPDGLHPNTAGYRRIAERFLPAAWGADGFLA